MTPKSIDDAVLSQLARGWDEGPAHVFKEALRLGLSPTDVKLAVAKLQAESIYLDRLKQAGPFSLDLRERATQAATVARDGDVSKEVATAAIRHFGGEDLEPYWPTAADHLE